ncbi:MAG: DUF1788 domain-containing protein [Gammaproteobacteria bacterium]|nr:DUF1788 domain-containing protein [Gammaproteobacteria bacterium]MBT7209303.1 DUF1788 domain-containing protein [Gammaproteobacteria bacterium]
MDFKKGINFKNLEQAYVHLSDVIASDRFLSNQGLNNEVPFHICPFDPAIQGEVNLLIKQLINYLRDAGTLVLKINLYDLVIEILKAEGDWQWLLDNESGMSRDELKEELQGVLDIETVLTPAISTKMQNNDFQVMFITGVSEVFPYIRSHNVLNNLQKTAKEKPTLMFFPGEYQHSLDTGASLVLFGKLQDDKYYRAFNILDRAS